MGGLLLLLLLLDELTIASRQKSVRDIRVEESVTDCVEPGLKVVQIAVQPLFENLVDGAELKLGDQASGKLFGVIGEPTLRHTRNAPKSVIELIHTKADGAWEILVEQQEFCNQPRTYLPAVDGFV